MSAIRQSIQRAVHVALYPFKAAVKAALRFFIRRISAKFADDFLPLAELAEKIEELANRQDRQEGFHWDHAALAKRLAAIEDRLEHLQRLPCGPEERRRGDQPTDDRPVIRLVSADADRAAPTVLERQYRWEKTG